MNEKSKLNSLKKGGRSYHEWLRPGPRGYEIGRFITKIAPHRWRCPECECSLTVGVELVPLHSRLTKQAEAEALGLYKARKKNAGSNKPLPW